MDDAYEVILAAAAKRLVSNLPDPRALARCLETELADGPNSEIEVTFDCEMQVCSPPTVPGGTVYTATPLSFEAYTALHRPLTSDELKQIAEQNDHDVADRGFYVLDILPAESAFFMPPRLFPPGAS
jgi:hypothetical protein